MFTQVQHSSAVDVGTLETQVKPKKDLLELWKRNIEFAKDPGIAKMTQHSSLHSVYFGVAACDYMMSTGDQHSCRLGRLSSHILGQIL